MTIGVTAASGQLGRLVVERLKGRVGEGRIVALARTPAKIADLGVAVRQADYSRPATLGPALAGIETLLLISGSEAGKREAQHRNVIEAAKAAGVKRIAYTSLLHADVSELCPAVEHRATEAALSESGLPFTLLRNGSYTENYIRTIVLAIQGGAVVGAVGEGRIAAAARADYAEAAAVAITGEGHEGKVYELAGDEAFTLSDLAAEISRQSGRDIPYRHLSEAAYSAALHAAGLPAWHAAALAGADVAASRGARFDDGRQLSALIGRPTTPLSATVAEVLKTAG